MTLPVQKPLGELEATVLSALWSSASPLSVRDVLTLVKRRPALAYTTVLTVLDRLHDKGLVARKKEGKAFLYRPRVSREVWLGERAVHALTDAREPPNQAVLMAFLDSAEKADPALLDRLSAMIAQRRKDRDR
ncbi:MAG: BlaI/MecI/CopY family transcriptional regulator [Byssovorax sp.]